MRKIYFVRHAKPDFSIKNDLVRPLTEEGISDCKKVTKLLERIKNLMPFIVCFTFDCQAVINSNYSAVG